MLLDRVCLTVILIFGGLTFEFYSVSELFNLFYCLQVYLVDASRLIGPLYPQELKELILLKYKEVWLIHELYLSSTPRKAEAKLGSICGEEH